MVTTTIDCGLGIADPTTRLSYDATETRGRRRAAPSVIRSEDSHATERKRRLLSANTHDLERNFELAAWAIRKHLDYVTQFSFQAKTPDRGFNAELEAAVEQFQTRERFDAARRHPARRFIRLAEACRAKDGDIGLLKLVDFPFRGMLQAIESDKITMPPSEIRSRDDGDSWVNGVKIGTAGAAIAYGLSDRDKQGRLTLRRIVPSRAMIFHGFYQRFDQIRGISPLASALNRWRDTYEGFDYALAKVKVSQLFGLEVYREGEGPLFGNGTTSPTFDGDGDGNADSGYEVNMSGGGPFMLDLDPGDRVGILESKNPSAETVNFLKLAIHLSLKAFDIPFSFFDESFTNFYGSRGGLIQYLRSCRTKIQDLQDLLDEWASWRLGLAVLDGELALPSGKDFSFLNWEFVPEGVPWWDPVKEATGAGMAIGLGASSPQREARSVGTDFEENILETAEALRFAREHGVELSFGKAGAEAASTDDAAEEKEKVDGGETIEQ